MRLPLFLVVLFVVIYTGTAGAILPVTQPKGYWAGTPCTGTQLEVLFINGINTTMDEADDASVALWRKFNKRGLYCITFDVSYNKTGGILADLLESSIQWWGQDTTQYWLFHFGLSNVAPEISSENNAAIIAAAELAQAAYDAGGYILNTDLFAIVNKVDEITESGTEVAVIAHSQGNYYANQMYRLAKHPTRIANIAVATPASKVEGALTWPWDHVTLDGDFIWRIPNALSPNSDNGDCGTQVECHNFIKSYLAGNDSWAKIFYMVVSSLYGPPSPLFSYHDAVAVTNDYTRVFETANGIWLGFEQPNVKGTVEGGPLWGGGYWWWQVAFEDGMVGWVAEEYLQEVTSPETVVFSNTACGTADVSSLYL